MKEAAQKKMTGAFNIICARLFYNKNGNISLPKAITAVSVIGFIVFFVPKALIFVAEIAILALIGWVVYPVIKAFIDGKLEEASDVTSKIELEK